MPTRVHHPNGLWSDVDPTLVAAVGGWRPRSSSVDVTFSDGGAGPFATYRLGGQTLTLSWPFGSLAKPVVSGGSVEYPNALPGVNLWAYVTPTGFRPVLEVSSPGSAALPGLRGLSFGVGGTVHVAAGSPGTIRFVDQRGVTVAVTDPATMWDSTGAIASPAGSAGVAAPAVAEPSVATASTATNAGDGARVRSVTVHAVGSTTMAVRPDLGLLTGSATAYPVFVDPQISPSQTTWAYADSCNANNVTDYARVGHNSADGCNYRSYFSLPTSQGGLSWTGPGHVVTAAEFDAELFQSWSCTSTTAWAYITGGITAKPRIPWSGSGSLSLPGSGGVSASGHADKDSGCSDSPQVDMLMRFKGQALTDYLNAHAVPGGWKTVTIGLCACDPNGNGESTQNLWKKFYIDSRAKFVVTYDTIPTAPAQLSTAGVACGASIGTSSPVLKAQAVDADTSDTMSGSFHWRVGTTGTVTSVPFSGVPANNYATTTLQLGSPANGTLYQWQVQSKDAANQVSPWSSWCSFTYVGTVPNNPTVTPTGQPSYVECNPALLPGNGCTAAGGPGISGSFVLAPNGSTGVTSFTYGWSNPPTTTVIVASGASATVTVTPPHYGLNTLYVSDSNGVRSGGPLPFNFLVAVPSNAIADYELDSLNGAGYSDVLGINPALTPNSGVSWVDDVRYVGAQAASFDGSTGAATATVAQLDTSHSFSVGAWVRPTAIGGGAMTAVGQDGVTAAGFSLGLRYVGASPFWSFTMPDSDAGGATLRSATAPAGFTSTNLGQWVYLTGVYDAGMRTIGLYVNGVLAQTGARTAAGWRASGPLSVGRGRSAGAPGERFPGQVADVRLWSRAVTTDDLWGVDIAPESGVYAAQAGVLSPLEVGHWDFGDVAGCSCGGPSLDTATFGRGMYLDPGFANVPPSSEYTSLSVDGNGGLTTHGVSGYASTKDLSDAQAPPVPVLRTDQSFTLSVWVLPKQETDLVQTVVQQGNASQGAVKLAIGADNLWRFSVTNPDGAGGLIWKTAKSDQAATFGQWTHVVGVFDVVAGTVTVYVDGVQQAAVITGATGWYDGASSLRLGGTSVTEWFDGSIDDVRLFQGVLSDRQVSDLFAADHI